MLTSAGVPQTDFCFLFAMNWLSWLITIVIRWYKCFFITYCYLFVLVPKLLVLKWIKVFYFGVFILNAIETWIVLTGKQQQSKSRRNRSKSQASTRTTSTLTVNVVGTVVTKKGKVLEVVEKNEPPKTYCRWVGIKIVVATLNVWFVCTKGVAQHLAWFLKTMKLRLNLAT